MDKSIVAVEKSCSRRNESLASASKCSGSLVQINSIAIDINCAMEMEEIEAPKHEHFSIRGFVSEMRKKDRKVCLPFASSEGGDNDDTNSTIPPLSVPKFRWWRCSDCVSNIADDQRSTLGLMLLADSGEKNGLLVQSIEANPFETRETHNNTADASNILHAPDENPCTKTDEPENASSGSDDNIAFSALPHKRKPKLRSLADIINEEKNITSEADLNPHEPQLEVSLDVAKSTKTPQRKQKNIVLEEDRGPPETNPPIITAKRLKGSNTEAENNNNNNTCKRVEVPESDSDRDRPARLDLRISSKTQPNKSRKQKALDINRKTMINAVHCANLQKYPVAARTTSFGNIGPFFKNSLFGQQMDSISDHVSSKGTKRPEEGDYSPYMPNVQEKVALDLSLSSYKGAGINPDHNQESSGKHTGIPDLNESFVEKTYMTEGQQVPMPTLHQTTSFAFHRNLDISASSSKDTPREGKIPFGISEQYQQAVQNTDNNITVVERGVASDDIPMEIVELLAKNQHERALYNSRKHHVHEGINSFFKGSPYYVENTVGPISFPYTNARTGVNQEFLNFPQLKNCHSDISNSDKSQFRQSGTPLTLYSVPNSFVSRPRPSEGADLLWPPRRKNITFDLTSAQNRSTQPSALDDQSCKYKNVGYMKGEGKKAVNDECLVKDGRIGPGRKSVGSIDAYSNDSIPAMQLLSLMDQGIVSGSSFKAGPNNFLHRQFSPCNHHPRLNKNDNPFVSSSFFGQCSHTKDFPSLLNGVRYSGDSSKKSFSQGQMSQHNGNSKVMIDSAGPSNLATQPSRSDLTLGVCMLNRNPADFSIPDAKNLFTICAKDFKRKKIKNSPKGRPRHVNVEGLKRQRMRKDSARKENSRK